MSKKNKPDTRGFVYSTDPNFSFEAEGQDAVTLPPAQQKLRIWLETKQRGGKAATVITVAAFPPRCLVSSQMRSFCWAGGRVTASCPSASKEKLGSVLYTNPRVSGLFFLLMRKSVIRFNELR